MKPDPARLDAAIYPYAIEITTRFGDMDVNHHLNNVAYARYFEEARVTFNSDGLLTDRGHRLPALKHHRIMVASVAISYLREGHYGPPVRIGIGVSSIGNASFAMAAAAFQSGQCLATHEATIVVKGEDGSGIPAEIRPLLAARMLKSPA